MMLIDQLIDQLDITRQQAEGGAGLLLQYVQTRLSSEEFLLVADAIPAVSDLIGKAPRQVKPTKGPLLTLWQRWFSGWGRLASRREAFERLGLEQSMVEKLKAALIGYFSEQGGFSEQSGFSEQGANDVERMLTKVEW